MKLSREWLNEFTPITVSDKEYADRMTMSGSKVEGFEKTGGSISNIVAGRVIELVRHENSDHLWVCSIDAGKEEALTIVTGAQNVCAGDLVPVALHGSTLYDGTKIKSGKLRGVKSEGMLCSLGELGLSVHDYPYAIEDGIFILQEPCEIGEDIRKVLGLSDTVVEFEITSNRPDCLSMRGMARESAATFGTPLALPVPAVKKPAAEHMRDYLQVEVQDFALCPRYTARMVKNIKIEPSPTWMRRRLRAAGIRPINNIVDITNYVMLEYGQPMHAFDYACVSEGKIIVRRAQKDEHITTLDDTQRALSESMLLITDPQKPIGIAGVMGGANSEITESTQMIVFESANFNGTSVRKTSIALGLRTDSSGRYEKGLDIYNTLPAIERACELVEQLSAGEVLDGIVDLHTELPAPVSLPLAPQKVNALLGTDIAEECMHDILRKLEFTVRDGMVTVPSFRSDVEQNADLIEEIARFYGYDLIPTTMVRGETTQGGYNEKQCLAQAIGSLFRGMGFYEILTYSFTGAYAWDKINLPSDSSLRNCFQIQNPLGEDTAIMRTTSLPSMLEVLSTNLSKRNLQGKFYEFATTYLPQTEDVLAKEEVYLTLGAYGDTMDFFALKGAVETLLASLRIADYKVVAQKENAAYHPGRCASLYVGDRYLGVIGQIHPSVCAAYNMPCAVYAAELSFAQLSAARGAEPHYKPLPKFPAITRDLALICDAQLPVAALSESIQKAGGAVLESCKLFDIYTGSPIPEGKKSVAFALTLRSQDQTLTDENAEKLMKKILAVLESEHHAVIR